MVNRIDPRDVARRITEIDDAIDLGNINRDNLSSRRTQLYRQLEMVYVDGVETPADTYQD